MAAVPPTIVQEELEGVNCQFCLQLVSTVNDAPKKGIAKAVAK